MKIERVCQGEDGRIGSSKQRCRQGRVVDHGCEGNDWRRPAERRKPESAISVRDRVKTARLPMWIACGVKMPCSLVNAAVCSRRPSRGCPHAPGRCAALDTHNGKLCRKCQNPCMYDNGVVASTHADRHDVNVMEKLGQNQEPSAMDKLKTSASETVHNMAERRNSLPCLPRRSCTRQHGRTQQRRSPRSRCSRARFLMCSFFRCSSMFIAHV